MRFRPPVLLALESHFQYRRKPARCQPTTVLGVTKMRGSFHRYQILRNATQNTLWDAASRRRGRCAYQKLVLADLVALSALRSFLNRLLNRRSVRLSSENSPMSLETILIIVVIVFLLGGGGWYWQRGRG